MTDLLVDRTQTLNVQLKNAKGNIDDTSDEVATYCTIISEVHDELNLIFQALQFPVIFAGGTSAIAEDFLSPLKNAHRNIKKSRERFEEDDFESAKGDLNKAYKALRKLKGTANDALERALSSAHRKVSQTTMSTDQYNFFLRSLPEGVRGEFEQLQQSLNRLIDKASVNKMGAEKVKNTLERYERIIEANKLEYPEAVEEFLALVIDRRTTTTLAHLTPEVLEYLKKHKLATGYQINAFRS